MSIPTFYIPPEAVDGGTGSLKGDELRHARVTLRLGKGDAVRIVDGAGSSYYGRIRSMAREEAVLTLSHREVEPEPAFSLTVAMGIVQGERFDWAIQKGTELGVTGFIPLVTERTQHRVTRQWKRLDRLRRIIVSAGKQCGRARFPTICEPVPLDALDTSPYERPVVFWEEKGSGFLRKSAGSVPAPRSCLMVIGPVGGLTEDEVKILVDKGCLVAGLGPRVLRTETAVAAGVTLLQYLWGDMGGE